ncbi:carboxylesterase family protein [Prauserella cavernicola]|uniref:Carboxylesterase/lipase family protein n=1 Tax=Prauserella cavernicola TaxID=2800127 RepID=A0A934QUV0_9PSEU|nr:carboxylesterase family protein [Prauserella cavernicola]MBK1786034.1 carboxylesterase/lipase family protein [Prauserella cavernicola]
MRDTTDELGERAFDTPAGQLLGLVDGAVVRMLGIPYATADRFAPPRPVPPFDEPFAATERAPAAPQHPSELLARLIGDDDLGQDEHCQRLSVTVPADLADDEQLPVLVWIHGGSYVTGAGDLAVYDPRALVVEQRVVVVSLTYRLGVLGFLGDGVRAPANLGLLDQLVALRWVRDNIAALGGDPALVTVFGQSAGGDAIAQLMLTDEASGLFRRAVIQSAPLGITHGRDAMTRAMLAAVGDPPVEASVDEVLALQPVAERAARRFGLAGGMPFGVQYGLPPVPGEADRDAAWRTVAPSIDVLIGSTAEETALFIAAVPALDRLFRVPVLGRLVRRALVGASTRRIYESPARAFARRHREAGGRATRYRLTWRPEGSEFGAAHVTDIPLLFGSRRAWEGAQLLGEATWADIERHGRRIRRIWGEFARTGMVPPDAASDTIAFPRD